MVEILLYYIRFKNLFQHRYYNIQYMKNKKTFAGINKNKIADKIKICFMNLILKCYYLI